MKLIGQKVNLVDKDGAIITNPFFKAEPRRFCVIHLTFPYDGEEERCGGKKEWNVFQSWHYCYCTLLLIVPSSWKGIKEPIGVWTHTEKHQSRKKIPMLLLPDFHYAEHSLGNVLLYVICIIYSSNRGMSENIWPGHIVLGKDKS